ncbi:MAG: 50S ribosomal protein L32 [Flavobacteriales bacterium]|nr:50S ribosomal protein L32 [Flavobacteriales bacterium]
MAHPKRKISKSRRDKRRTHYKASATTLAVCSNCNSPVQYHHVCGDCGYYKGKLAVEKAVAV